MEITNGAMSYSLVFDISQGEASIEKIKESFEAMGFSAEDAGKMADELATEMTESLQRIADSATNAEDAVAT